MSFLNLSFKGEICLLEIKLYDTTAKDRLPNEWEFIQLTTWLEIITFFRFKFETLVPSDSGRTN